MGVNDLWSVLSETGKPISIEDISNKTLAVDLSLWLYQSLSAPTLKDVPGIKLPFRTIFWKIYKLLLLHVRPIFVLEGTAPLLKKDTQERRQRALQRKQNSSQKGERVPHKECHRQRSINIEHTSSVVSEAQSQFSQLNDRLSNGHLSQEIKYRLSKEAHCQLSQESDNHMQLESDCSLSQAENELCSSQLSSVCRNELSQLESKSMLNITYVASDSELTNVKWEPLGQRAEPSTDHSRLKLLQDKCVELLRLLNLPFIQASGEAEATCAYLNRSDIKFVDGVLSEDSDVFLFGGQTVYRHFSADSNRKLEMSVYDMTDIEDKLHLNRRKLIAYALLVGCDYTKGVKYVGKEKALRWLNSIDVHEDPLDRLAALSSSKERNNCVRKPAPPHCLLCGHEGSEQVHLDCGCLTCDTPAACLIENVARLCSCECRIERRRHEDNIDDTKISKLLLNHDKVTDEQVIDLFLNPCCDVDWTTTHWKKPNFRALIEFCQNLMNWERDEAERKILPLLTSYFVSSANTDSGLNNLTLGRILNKQRRKGTDIFNVEWLCVDGLKSFSDGEPLVTDEKCCLMQEKFPNFVQQYESLARTTFRGIKRRIVEKGQQTIKNYCNVKKKRNNSLHGLKE